MPRPVMMYGEDKFGFAIRMHVTDSPAYLPGYGTMSTRARYHEIKMVGFYDYTGHSIRSGACIPICFTVYTYTYTYDYAHAHTHYQCSKLQARSPSTLGLKNHQWWRRKDGKCIGNTMGFRFVKQYDLMHRHSGNII